MADARHQKVLRYIDIAKADGARLVMGGERPAGQRFERGFWVEPKLESSSTGLEVTPLSPAVGAQISGIDLRREQDEVIFDCIRRAWYDHNILLFRGQQLSAQDQVRVAERFGELAKLHNKPGNAGVTEHPSVMLISNIRQDGKLIGALPDGEMVFHSDQCYLEKPCMATMLYAIEIPSEGGNTLFADMYKAYEALPQEMKRRIANLKAMNVYDYEKNPTSRPIGNLDGTPAHAHPVVRVHPVTARKALFVNRLMTAYIVDLPRAESDEILQFLFEHQEQAHFVHEHVWTPGDLMLWDNRSSLHARTVFSPEERRLLRRVIIQHEHAA